MKNMKYFVTFGIAFVCAMFLATCDNSVESGYGRIRIAIAEDVEEAGSARTVLPSAVFDNYIYTFIKAGEEEENGEVKIPDGDGFFVLEFGSYTVKVLAFIGSSTVPSNLAASGISEQFSVGSGVNTPVKVNLSGFAEATQGKFNYTINYPSGAEAVITMQKWPDLNSITLNPANVSGGNGKTQTLQLNPGSYLLTVFVIKDNLYAGINETVHISSLLTTTYTKDFIDSELISARPPLPGDYTVGGTGTFTYDGGAKTASVTRNETASLGAVTVFYNGLTTAPVNAGEYPVTFDVAAAPGFSAATGLPAGTITIGKKTPVADDYNISGTGSFMIDGSAKTVSVTRKETASLGAVTIYYGSSTAAPVNSGTYNVTFDVAAAANWNAASGLSAGSIIINSTPTYGINLSATGTQSLGRADYGYSVAPSALAVTVRNTGNQATGALTVALSGTNASSFTLSTTSITSIATNGNASFNVSPVTGLAIGAHNATVTVSGGNGITANFSVRFIVHDPASPYIITYSGSTFTAARDSIDVGSSALIQDVIESIRAYALGGNVIIQFGNGTTALSASVKINGIWGPLTLRGSITSGNNNPLSGTVTIEGNVSVTIAANIANTSTGSIGKAVYNNSTGVVTISAGTISATKDVAVYHVSTGKIIVSGTANITSTNTSSTFGNALTNGAIYLENNGSNTDVRLEVTGGTISNTADDPGTYGNAIRNDSHGAITISGGTVRATRGSAVYNYSDGKITVSGTAYLRVTSQLNKDGVIFLGNNELTTGVWLEITGGTITNDNGTAIVNNSTRGGITISGGTVSAVTAIRNNSSGTINISGGSVSATGDAVYNDSSSSVIISGGSVSAQTGNAIRNSYSGNIIISGGTVSSTTSTTVVNTLSGGSASITISGGTVSATTGTAVSSSSSGTITVSGTALVTSANTDQNSGTIYRGNPPNLATSGWLEITGGTVENTSTTTGIAIYNASSYGVNISGGKVSSVADYAVYSTIGKITISGTALVTSAAPSGGTIYIGSIYNTSEGRLDMTGGTVENTSTTTGSTSSAIRIFSLATNGVNITGGTVSKAGDGNYAVYKAYPGCQITISPSVTIIGNNYGF